MSAIMPETKRWTRSEYHAAAAAGVFQDERVELIRGEILTMSPMDARHATGIQLVQQALQSTVTKPYTVRVQLPLALTEHSEPEPDLSVVRGNPRDFAEEHPTTAELVIEVSQSTLTYDQTSKRRLYAEHGIAEYWILNLKDRQLEIHRSPENGDYTEVTVVDAQGSTTPLIFPNDNITVADLLP